MAQETIQCVMAMSQEAQETCYRAQESLLRYKLMCQKLLGQPNVPYLWSFRLFCSFTNSDFLEFPENSTRSCTSFWPGNVFFWFEDIQTLPSSQASVENLPFGHRYNILGA